MSMPFEIVKVFSLYDISVGHSRNWGVGSLSWKAMCRRTLSH